MLRPALLLMLAAGSLAAQAFEGVVSLTIASERGAMPMEYQIKAGKMRLDMSGGAGMQVGMIIDPSAKKMLMIIEQQRMYMEQDLAEPMAAAGQRAGGSRATVARTGRIETIAGFRCEHITVTEEGGATSDACVTNDLGAAFQLPMGGGMMGRGRGGPAPGWASGLENAFPLKVVQNGATVLEVTKIERKTLDASRFAPPEGFQKMDMGMMRRP